MNYRVIWHPRALPSLQKIYNAALDQEGVVHAVKRLELELGANPAETGESRELRTRIHFKFPLIVWFFVDERMKEVWIVNVNRFRRLP